MERVFAYIDGFNLYGGLKDAKLNSVLWLNIRKLVGNLLNESQKQVYTKYFTSRLKYASASKKKRQDTFLEAVETLEKFGDFKIYYGKFESNDKECTLYFPDHHCLNCNGVLKKEEEKRTDVNITVQMISDAENDLFDAALLISGDTDFIPVMNYIHKKYPQKRVIVAFPPERWNDETADSAKSPFIIGRNKLRNSLFDDEMENKYGYTIKRPIEWY